MNIRPLVNASRCSGSYDFQPRRICKLCGLRKPIKGGRTLNGRGFLCADCKPKQVAK